MKDYEKASVKIATSLAFLNSGQGAIFSSALTLMMYLAAKEVLAGETLPSRCLLRLDGNSLPLRRHVI